MPAPAVSPRSWELGDVVFWVPFGLFPVGSQAMTHAKQGIELFNATKDTSKLQTGSCLTVLQRWEVLERTNLKQRNCSCGDILKKQSREQYRRCTLCWMLHQALQTPATHGTTTGICWMKTGRDSVSMESHLWESSAARNWSCKTMDVDLDMPGTLDWPLRRLRFDQGHGSRNCRSCQAGQLKFIAEDRDLLNGIPAVSPAEDTALKQAETKIGEFS